MSKFLRVAIGCICLLPCLANVSQAKEWQGIVPLHSTRNDVRRLLGQPLSISSEFSDSYDVKDGRVHIMYVRKKCEQGLPANWGNWNVPPYTVVNISVYLEKSIPITDLGIPDIEKLKWYTDDALFTYYRDKKEGVSYETHDEVVRSMTYGPTEKDQQLLCKKDASEIRY